MTISPSQNQLPYLALVSAPEESDLEIGTHYEITGEDILIGSAPYSAICLPDSVAAVEQALFFYHEGHFHVEDLTDNYSYQLHQNGVFFTHLRFVEDGERFSIGTTEFALFLGTTSQSFYDQNIHKRSMTDHLMKIHNRRYFEQKAACMLAALQTKPNWVSILVCDIDYFRNINSSYGHKGADEVLTSLGRLLSSLVRDQDVLARCGGEEIMLLLPNTPHDSALEFAERIRRTVAEMPFTARGQIVSPPVTLSIGVATTYEFIPMIDFIHEADIRMYEAKAKGRNQVVGEKYIHNVAFQLK